MVLNYFGSTPLGYCLLLYSVLDQRSNKMDKKNTFIKCLLYNTWVLSTWIRVLQKKSHSHYSLTCFWPQLYKFFSGLGSRWLGDVSRNCHSSIQCLKTERMLCAWRCFRHLGKQWPIRQNPYLSRPVTKWGWLVIQTSWHDSDRLGGRVFFWMMVILQGGCQEKSLRGGDIWSGAWMARGRQGVLATFKGAWQFMQQALKAFEDIQE